MCETKSLLCPNVARSKKNGLRYLKVKHFTKIILQKRAFKDRLDKTMRRIGGWGKIAVAALPFSAALAAMLEVL